MTTAARPRLAWVDGRLMPLAEATVPLEDRGFLLGDGVFETLRAHRGTPFRPTAHLDRLEAGLDVLGLDVAARTAAKQALTELARAFHHAAPGTDARLRVQVTGGRLQDLDGPGTPVVTGLAVPLRPVDGPARLWTTPQRIHRDDPLTGVKHLAYMPRILARREAKRRGFDDVLFRNDAGRPCEGATSNLMAVRGGVLHAPGRAEGALAGVTRSLVLEAARELGLDVEERLTDDGLKRADEVFLTATSYGTRPVVRVDDHDVPAAGHDAVRPRLQQALEAAWRAPRDD